MLQQRPWISSIYLNIYSDGIKLHSDILRMHEMLIGSVTPYAKFGKHGTRIASTVMRNSLRSVLPPIQGTYSETMQSDRLFKVVCSGYPYYSCIHKTDRVRGAPVADKLGCARSCRCLLRALPNTCMCCVCADKNFGLSFREAEQQTSALVCMAAHGSLVVLRSENLTECRE